VLVYLDVLHGHRLEERVASSRASNLIVSTSHPNEHLFGIRQVGNIDVSQLDQIAGVDAEKYKLLDPSWYEYVDLLVATPR